MFCGCALSFGEEPNTRTCPICLGHPGTLPVTNAEAVHFGLMIAMALECEVAPRSIFHRKNYFYPDLPKGYQISQYDIPLGSNGRLGDVRVHRVHLEEDAAKLVHAGLVRADPLGRGQRRRLQPRRHAARGDRERAGPALGGRGRRVGAAPARDAEAARRVRREHGGGLAAGGRERVDPPGRRQHARHQDRAEEHELVPLPRARHRGRARAPGADPARRRRGRAGDAPLRPRHRRDQLAALEGGGARLPLLPGAGPRAARADRGDARAGPRRRCRSCRPREPSASSATSA